MESRYHAAQNYSSLTPQESSLRMHPVWEWCGILPGENRMRDGSARPRLKLSPSRWHRVCCRWKHPAPTGSRRQIELQPCNTMNTQLGLEKCLPFINAELQPDGRPPIRSKAGGAPLTVTISRQTGSGAHTVGEMLRDYLQAAVPKEGLPWILYDRNLVEKVLKDHNLPQHLARFMSEDRISPMTDTMDELLGTHPPSWLLVQRTVETILRLAERGNVILIGRGANVITRQIEQAFHVRLVASLETRVEHIREIQNLGKRAALEFIRKEDRGRTRYLKKYFGKDLEDPLLYHLVLNTDTMTYNQAARLIGDTASKRFHPRSAGREPDLPVARVAEAMAIP